MPQNFNPGRAALCARCGDEGMYIGERNTRIFCSCTTGQQRERMWNQAQERVKLEARARQEKRDRKHRRMVNDYKAKAAGNDREPGEEG